MAAIYSFPLETQGSAVNLAARRSDDRIAVALRL
jgi:hypothetical protein